MVETLDIHHYDKELIHEIEFLKRSNLSVKNQELIIKFDSYNLLEKSLGRARRIKYIRTLRWLANRLQKDFDQVTKEDLQAYIIWLENSHYSLWSRHDFRVVLKLFYRWLCGSEEYPPLVKWIAVKRAKVNKLPEQLLTQEEIERMINCSSNPRDKAFVAVLAESGARVSEIGNLQLNKVAFDDKGCVIDVNGKTGSRRIRLISSAPLLANWIANHPRSNITDGPLWVSNNNPFNHLTYSRLFSILTSAAVSAGIQKRIHPHLFRHSRATCLAANLTEAQMKVFFGWTPGSEMASIYVHLSCRDIDPFIVRLNNQRTESILPPTPTNDRNETEDFMKFYNYWRKLRAITPQTNGSKEGG